MQDLKGDGKAGREGCAPEASPQLNVLPHRPCHLSNSITTTARTHRLLQYAVMSPPATSATPSLQLRAHTDCFTMLSCHPRAQPFSLLSPIFYFKVWGREPDVAHWTEGYFALLQLQMQRTELTFTHHQMQHVIAALVPGMTSCTKWIIQINIRQTVTPS